MYDIKPLEEEWRKYNKKKRKPLYLTFTVLFFLIAAAALLKYKNISFPNFEHNVSSLVSNTVDSNVLLDKSITVLEVKKELPKANVLGADEIKPGKATASGNNPMEPGDVFVEENVMAKKPTRTVQAPVVEHTRSKKKLHIVMTEASSPTAFKDIEDRFSVAPDTDDSLFLARGYYKKGKYSKAAYWALQTNKLNGDIEESWLIFARSKAKTGQKNEAIRVLSQYAKKSNSVKANKLLKQLKK